MRLPHDTIERSRMSEGVVATGVVPWTSLPARYHAADIFAFASTSENCPVNLLDAMGADLAIACTDRPPLPEFVGGAARYFDPLRVGSIARLLARMLADTDLRALVARR